MEIAKRTFDLIESLFYSDLLDSSTLAATSDCLYKKRLCDGYAFQVLAVCSARLGSRVNDIAINLEFGACFDGI